MSRCKCLGGFVLVVFLAVPAGAMSLGGNEDISDGVLSGTPDSVTRLTGTDGSRGNPYILNWADANGDGVAGPVASANLNLGSYKLYDNRAVDTTSFVLVLNGGSVTGSTAAGAVAIDTGPGTGYKLAGHVTISNVNDVTMGQIVSARSGQSTCGGGNITVGSASLRAGNVQVGGLDAHGDVYSGSKDAGDVTIYSCGHVRIRNDAGPQSIVTWLDRAGEASYAGDISIYHEGELIALSMDTKMSAENPGHVYADGDYGRDGNSYSATIGGIRTGKPGVASRSGNVTIRGYQGLTVTGDVVCSSAAYEAGSVRIDNIGTGGVSLRDVLTYHEHVGPSYGRDAGDVTITNVAGPVELRNVDTHTSDIGAGYHWGGDLTVVCGGDLTVRGSINLNAAGGDAKDGNLTLMSSGGAVRIPNLDMGAVGWAKLDYPMIWLDYRVRCLVTGVVASFATNYTGGAGFPLDPYVTTQTELRAPAGRKIMYFPGVSGNEYLGGVSYRLASLAGTAGQGGVLTPYQAKGTVVFFR